MSYKVTSADIEKFEAATRGFFAGMQWANPYAVSLTLKVYSEPEWLDRIAATQNVHHFLNRLNRKLLGPYTKKKLRTFSVYEAGGRPHFHMCVDCPTAISADLFRDNIEHAWASTRWSRKQVDVQPCYYLDGWLSYMTKQKTKACYLDAIDWRNCY